MVKWKLSRLLFGSEEFTFSDGEKVTIGRGIANDISLPSTIVSRKHCVIEIQTNNALITDLKSSNGVYVGAIKVPPNQPYVIEDSDVIGIGWTTDVPLLNLDDDEKYLFKFKKEKCELSLPSRIQYQSDDDIKDIKTGIPIVNGYSKIKLPSYNQNPESPVLSLKRKLNNTIEQIIKEEPQNQDDDVIYISDSASTTEPDIGAKKVKLETTSEQPQNCNKNGNELVDYDAFTVKQEYDDELFNRESDSDSESEHWLMRLSQNSPGKPFTKIAKSKLQGKPEDNSYSQLDEDFISNSLIYEDEEEFERDIICIPEEKGNDVLDTCKLPDNISHQSIGGEKEAMNDNIGFDKLNKSIESLNKEENINKQDTLQQPDQLPKLTQSEVYKKAQMIEPLVQLPKPKLYRLPSEPKPSTSVSRYSDKVKKSRSKKHVTPTKNKILISQKEQRKNKLKEIAIKDKEIDTKTNQKPGGSSKPVINVKNTSSNRGAFLSDAPQAIVKRKTKVNKSKDETVDSSSKLKESKSKKIAEKPKDMPNDSEKPNRDKSCKFLNKDETNINTTKEQEPVPLKNLIPINYCKESISGKPIPKVGPMPLALPKKKVRFSEEPPQVQEFEIEPGNRMKKTSLVKTTMRDNRQTPVFSLEKITLIKILRWNPHWLEEQLNNNDPPPILGHNNTPMTLFHFFTNHNQYVQFVGDLLLMEIWEYITIAHMKTKTQSFIQMVVESPLAVPSQERCFDLFNLSVTVSLHQSQIRNLPRYGEIMHISFGPENAKTERFFYVHNVRQLPPVPGQGKYLYSISLYASMTEKMMLLKPGEIMLGKSLAYIKKELTLFEAMEYLAGSPLRDAILQPKPCHFINSHLKQVTDNKSQWINTLNKRQRRAVNLSVAAALSDKPSIQMVQGPPGTGKSSVICAIVMTYFYDAQGKKQQNRGKILICATSNAAVDGLVIRLLNLRQSLPKPERFRMVRVGREEAMHPVAAEISSQVLAQRDVARINDQPPAVAGLDEEILHLEAKINMWKTAQLDTKDPQRNAYCQGRINDLQKRINLLRSGGGRAAGGEAARVAAAERRVVEHADIVVTTLASSHNCKMKGLKRRIALCIIDEAGQVIEPETLIPLTLDVTRLTLIGDPQQLPGFICSQRAKNHGLGESLFARLTSCTDGWPDNNPVVLLDQQYRMHPDIADYPSRAFYGGVVQTIQPMRPPNLDLPPYRIISISSGDKGQGMTGANEMEAWGVTRLVTALELALRPLQLSLAVITPYSGQRELIKKHLKTFHNLENRVEVNTVDSFQGQERDVIVVSLARSNGVGFLTDPGRMNVLLTRAKHALFICLNPFALMKHHQWRTLVEDAQRRNLYTTLPNNMCKPLTAEQVANDCILKFIIRNTK